MLYGNKIVGTVAYMGGVPSVFEKFCWSWTQMIQYNSSYLLQPGEEIFYDRATISYHTAARDGIVNKMQGDWLLMLDTDHQFDPDILARMLYRMNKYNLQVLVGMYQYKNPPYVPVIYTFDENKEFFRSLGDWDIPEESPYFIPIASAGAGCLLVKKSVFARIKDELNEGPFEIIKPFSEDHSFFKRLHKLGIQAYCDPSIECNHLEVKKITLKDYDKSDLVIENRKETKL